MCTNKKKNLLKTICQAHVGCGCLKLKLSDVYEATPKPKKTSVSVSHNPKEPCNSSSSAVDDKKNGSSSTRTLDNEAYAFSTTVSFNINDTSTQDSESEIDPKTYKVLSPCPKIIDSIVVVKDSNDPYKDFRRSMAQMVMEKEIYSNDDLKELLSCFLELNSPCHHGIILQAFTEICNEVMSKGPCVHDHPSTCRDGHVMM